MRNLTVLLKSNFKGIPVLYWILGLFTLIIYVTGLFTETFVDSARYAALSRGIFESGDFIHLKIQNEPYLQKPPLLFWLGALSFKVFGVSIFSFKLPNFFFTLLGIWSTYKLGSLIYDKGTGIIAAVVYTCSEALFLYNMDVHTDGLLTSCIIFGTWQLAEYVEGKKLWNLILGFTGVGLAMISKGMIGAAVPAMAIGGYLLTKRDFRNLFSLKWLAGLPILLIILYPTLKGLYDQFGGDGLRFFFWSNNIDRIVGTFTTRKPDYLFSFHTMIYIFLPWSMYAYIMIIKDFRAWYGNKFSIYNFRPVYCYSPLIILSLIVTVSHKQSPHFLLPIIPFISILTARLISDVAKSDLSPKTFRLMLILRSATVVLLWPAAIVMLVYFFPTKNILIWIPVILLLLLQVYSFLGLESRIQKLMIPLIVSILMVGFVANTNYMPRALKYHGPIQASFLYNKIAPDSSVLYAYRIYHDETFFYPKNVAIKIESAQLPGILSDGTSWFITSEEGLADIKSLGDGIVTEQHVFPFRDLTNVSLKFLNPVTRESTLRKIYLLKIK